MSKFYTNVKCIGNKIYVRGYYDGVPYSDVVEFQPTLYLRSKDQTEFKNLSNEYLRPIQKGTIRDTRKFLEEYKEVDGLDIYGNENPVYQYIGNEFPGRIEFDMKTLKIYYLDIETTSEYGGVDVEAAMEQILLITLMNYSTKKTVTFGTRPFVKNIENNHYVECKDEAELLERFLRFWEKSYPDAISGWAIETFDIPYIVKRIEKTLGENQAKRLSPWKYVRIKNIIDSKTGKTNEAYDIYGINVLDYLPYFKKYAGIGVENNKLDTVAKEVLGETKLDHTEYDTFADFYTKDWDLFVEYNIVDTLLIDKLENKLRLLQLAFTLAMDSKVNPEDTLSQGRMWDAIIYNYLLDKNIIIPIKKPYVEKTEKYKGAFVKPPQIGMFKWVASFDVSSLYPSLIRTFNISPETLIQEKNSYVTIDNIVDGTIDILPEHKSYSICANGSMYDNSKQGFLPKIMEDMFNERTVYKKKMIEYQKDYQLNPSKELEELVATYRIFQESKKQCLNSAYGSLGNNFFRFYDIRNAEAITYMGQAVIKKVEKDLNVYLRKITGKDIDMIIAGDTDSVAGDSIIKINNEEYPISEFFDVVSGEYLKYDSFNENYVKKVDGYTTISLSKNGELEYKPIKYVMKHKVKKRLYEITVDEKSVVVTEDHSVIAYPYIFENSEFISIRPSELSNEKHLLIYLYGDEISCDYEFQVKDLGIQEEWVYDIEVEDNHNFFANNICVHNSNFLNLEPVIDKIFKDSNPSEEEVIDFLCSICDNQIQTVIDKIFDNFTKTTNAFENHLHMKREKICSSGLWKAKKNYILNVWDNEGVRLSKPKIKISGIQAVKTSTPAVCRGKIRTAIEIIMTSTENELIKFVSDFKKEFFSLSPEEISFPRKVSDIDKWVSKTTTYIKGTPIQARAAILYNNGIIDKRLSNKYPLIKNGENIKFCYLRLPNPLKEDVIGFIQRFPTEFGLNEYLDYNKQFELTFIQPLTQLLDVIGWKTEKTQTLDDLFS